MSDLWPSDPALRALLDQSSPGAAALARLRAAWLAGELGGAHNRVEGIVRPPEPGDVHDWPGTDEENALARERGNAALLRGEVGLVVLNGGMATRFGGVVKGVVSVEAPDSFLGLKLLDALRVARHLGATPPVVILMNSRATTDATRAHLEAHAYFGYPAERVWMFEQQWTARLDAEGELFIEADGGPSFYGPGHGDLGACLRDSGLLDRFEAAGGRTILMSNVDNVVATLEASILGRHLEAAAPITVELVDKWAGDAGGAPAYVDGRMQIVEAFRFPEDFDASSISVFNTNTLWLETAVLQAEHPLTWFVVRKEVEGRPAIQFERLVGELTAFAVTHWLRVPRAGLSTRFVPIKGPAELAACRRDLMAAWRARAKA